MDKSVQQKHLRKLLLDEEKKIKQENENKGEKRSPKSKMEKGSNKFNVFIAYAKNQYCKTLIFGRFFIGRYWLYTPKLSNYETAK